MRLGLPKEVFVKWLILAPDDYDLYFPAAQERLLLKLGTLLLSPMHTTRKHCGWRERPKIADLLENAINAGMNT